MSHTSQAAAYRDTEPLSASPGQPLVAAHDRLLVSLRRARLAVDAGSAELRRAALETCRALLLDLLVAPDVGQGGASAGELSELYTSFLAELVDVGLHGDLRRLDGVTAGVAELRDAFARDAAEPGGREAAL